ncbi:hypothetical protein ACHWQZ_G002282 [Mnemiopsis leidyi]
MKNVGNHRKNSEGGSRGTPGSEDAYSTLQKNYNELLREHSRALIAVDQLRVAKYLARPRAYQSKGVGTPMETQTDNPDLPADMEAAVTELEAQITECVPLFTSNNDPVGDLQMLLQGLQGELAECLRNSNEMNCDLKDRIAECEEKIRNMEGALSLKILDQNNSRGNSRASSRAANRHGASLCHTSSLLSGADSSENNFSAVNSFPNLHSTSPHYNTSDFERDEELCDRDSLSDIIDMHNELRAESEGSSGPKEGSLWCLPVFSNNTKVKSKERLLPDRKTGKSKPKDRPKAKPKETSKKSPSITPVVISPSKPPKPPRKPLSIRLRIFGGKKQPKGSKYKRCISVVTDTDVAESLHSGQYVPRPMRRNDSYQRSCSENDSDGGGKNGHKHTSDSALGSSVTVNRKSNSIGVQEKPRTAARSVQGSLKVSNSDHSIASSKRMLYCTPIVGSQPPSRASTPAKGYDFNPGPNSYANSDYNYEVQDIFSGQDADRRRHSDASHRQFESSTLPNRKGSVEDEIAKRAPIRAKRSRVLRKEKATTGYDSGYNEEASRKSSPNRQQTNSLGSPKSSPRSAEEFRSEISMVRDDVQELADRLRNLRSSMTSSRSSSPVLPPRSHTTRDALRDRLRRLQCGSPANFEVGPGRSSSPDPDRYRSSSPASGRYNRSSSPRGYNRSSSPGARYTAPRSPVLGYPRSPRSHSPEVRNYRDTRHLFYDRPPEVLSSGYPVKPPIEVGVRIGGPSSSAGNFEVGPSHSPRAVYPIETFHVSPTSGLETHFHFNFYGQGSNNGDYPFR